MCLAHASYLVAFPSQFSDQWDRQKSHGLKERKEFDIREVVVFKITCIGHRIKALDKKRFPLTSTHTSTCNHVSNILVGAFIQSDAYLILCNS